MTLMFLTSPLRLSCGKAHKVRRSHCGGTKNLFDNKTILITGGTGSFGKAFLYECLLNHDPKKVIVYSRDENKQFHIAQDVSEKFPGKKNRVRFFYW